MISIRHKYKEGYRLLARIARDPSKTIDECEGVFDRCDVATRYMDNSCGCFACNVCVCDRCAYEEKRDPVVNYVRFVYVNEAAVFLKAPAATFWVVSMHEKGGQYEITSEVGIEPFEAGHAPFGYADMFRDMVDEKYPYLVKIDLCSAFENAKAPAFVHELYQRLGVIVHGRARAVDDNPHIAPKKGRGTRRK